MTTAIVFVAKAKRQLQVFSVAKAKRQLQVFSVAAATICRDKIDYMYLKSLCY
ncbi:hypothetical protein [Lysinibacillus sp. JNUCC 51]|uniref:hypothetical protein n=1 Tax=Lysinibacillus sp. JNUCC-51 TaxID=2792479 RepID=UPI0019380A8B|nr:hypothetical protein JNUCC51_17280 [Lysinibacillus sp. JNUCC-51]